MLQLPSPVTAAVDGPVQPAPRNTRTVAETSAVPVSVGRRSRDGVAAVFGLCAVTTGGVLSVKYATSAQPVFPAPSVAWALKAVRPSRAASVAASIAMLQLPSLVTGAVDGPLQP